MQINEVLEQIMSETRNWFKVGVHTGQFSVESGGIALPFLQPGQYFRVFGSVFNDGVHRYPANDMMPEKFDGVIWALAVPPAVVGLAEEIQAWKEAYGTIGPFQSESFDGYSYTRATNQNGQAVTWRDAFRSQLNRWRKI